MDIRQTKEWARYMVSMGWEIEKVKTKKGNRDILVYIKKLPWFLFSVLKGQRFKEVMDTNDLKRIIKKHKVRRSFLEPTKKEVVKNSKKSGFRQNRSPFLPSKTVVVDLKESKNYLWKNLSKDARYYIRKNDDSKSEVRVEIKEIGLESEKELEGFWKNWKRSKKGYLPSWKNFVGLVEAFGKKVKVWVAKKGDEDIAGMMMLNSDDTAFYYYAWTSREGRKSGVQYRLVWEGMLAAKKEGLDFWDFEGIKDERWPRKSWQGFSRFKKKFGGSEVCFPGCFGKWF